MIAITFALPAESSGLVNKLQSKRIDCEKGVAVVTGNIDGHEVAICHTGVGRQRCRQIIEPFLQWVRPQFLISSGFAGGLTDELKVGELIAAENFSDGEAIAGLINPRIRRMKLVTVERMMHSAEERARIAKEQSAAAIDMETDVIAEACARHTLRMVSLRVISDSPSAPFPAPPDVLFDMTRQKTNFRRLIPYLVTHPSAVLRLSRFARQISQVRGVLTDAVLDVITNRRLG